MATKRVVLVDGTGLLFRAWHALPSRLCTDDGLPTNAIFGFAQMFRKILQGRLPSHGVVVFDAGGTTARHALDPLYKAHRPRMPERLRRQLPGVHDVVEAHGFHTLEQPGVEADHVIATLCRQAVAVDASVTVVSGDKDFVPLLVHPAVRLFDSTGETVLDADRARRRWGVSADRFADWLALVGDRADGVPGIPGIGKRAAADLCQAYPSLDALLEASSALGPLGRTLNRNRDRLVLSRKLVTLDEHVPLPLALEDLEVTPATPADLNAAYQRYGFYSLLTATQASTDRAPQWYVVDSLPMTAAALQNECMTGDPTGLSVVTELEDSAELVGLALSPRPGLSFYFPFRGPGATLGEAGLHALRPWLENPRFPKVTHAARETLVTLSVAGITLSGLVGDTALASYLLDPTRDLPHQLHQVARRSLKRALQPLAGIVGRGRARKRFQDLTVDRAGAWANHLADATGEVWANQQQQVEEAGMLGLLHSVDLPLARVLADLERTGILLDPAVIDGLGQGFKSERASVAEQVFAEAGRRFTIGSPKQLGTVLFDELKLPVIRRTKTGYSTAAGVLDQLEHPIVEAVKRWRTLDTLVNTWTEVLVASVNPQTGRIHSAFQQTASASGRIISTDPDLQRTPVRTPEFRQIREAFIAPPGHVVLSADWSQVELRMLAHLSGDPRLLQAFQTGADLHRQTASVLFEVAPSAVTSDQRAVGKTVNFATVYGQGPKALSEQLGVSHRDAQRFIGRFFQTYAGVQTWRDQTVARAHLDGFVRTLGGRRRAVPELSTRTPADRAYGERIAMNTPIQGSVADLCKEVMVAVTTALHQAGSTARLTLQIHDELLFEVPVAEVERTSQIVRQVMETTWALRVPLPVDIGVGPNWAATK